MLRVERLTKIFDNATDQIAGGIRDASFTLEPGTFFTLLGPSGCGKTTTLRCIAGLETPDAGVIAVDGRRCSMPRRAVNVPVEQRSVGMVFQSYAIWPHMTVAQTSRFRSTVSKQRRYSRAEITEGVRRALATVDLDGFQERPGDAAVRGAAAAPSRSPSPIVHEPRPAPARRAAVPISMRSCATDMRGELKRPAEQDRHHHGLRHPTTSRRRSRCPTGTR
jgi:iron(III) transport system ATP-binding protein